MKILIGYDGSPCSEAALGDLRRAGLGRDVQALVMATAEAYPDAVDVPYVVAVGAPGWNIPVGMADPGLSASLVEQAKEICQRGVALLRAMFPNWVVDMKAWSEMPGQAIVREAAEFKADLIVLGCHGRGPVGRLLLGSVSKYVIERAPCSIRVGRSVGHSEERNLRLLIGIDGSAAAEAAVNAAAARHWPAGTEVRLLGVIDSHFHAEALAAVAAYPAATASEQLRGELSAALHRAAVILADRGLGVSHQILAGKPCETLLLEAERDGADCIFVGAWGLNRGGRKLGSVATAVAERAHCSVEIVHVPGAASVTTALK